MVLMKIVRINAMWCSGCLVMKKVWKEVLSLYPDIEVISLDYDMDEDEVKKYNPGKILPVAIFYKNNEEISRLNGEHTSKEIIEHIEGVK